MLDVFDPHPPRSSRMPAADVLRGVVDGDNGPWPLRRRASAQPVVRVSDRFLTGQLDLRAMELPYLLEFVNCRFEQPPDLRQSSIAGVEFDHCWLPGLSGRNLRSTNDVALIDSTVTGLLDLNDADVGGSLLLGRTTLRATGRLALHADRLVVAGALLAHRVDVEGELRTAGARIGGNCNFSGSTLRNPAGFVVNGNGMQVGGNLVFATLGADHPFTATGTLFLPNARISSALTLRGAVLTAGEPTASDDDDPHADPRATVVLDRVEVSGDVELDRGFRSDGTVRLVNAGVGGTLSLAGAVLRAAGEGTDGDPTGFGRAVHLDGAEINGDITARGVTVRGQLRMVDVLVRGSLVLNRAELANPRADALLANRCRVGSNLTARDAEVEGGLELRGVVIGANLDLRGSRITAPGRNRYSHDEKPSVDIGGATVGRDLVCASGHKEFVAHGGVRTRRAVVGRMANFSGAVLGHRLDSHALNALGMQVQELVLTTVSPPRGDVTLRHARCTTLDDNEAFWNATGRIDLDDFRYDSFANAVDLRDDDEIERRLRWLRQAMRRSYQPGPYDQLAVMLRAGGNDEHASTVLMEKQRLRHVAVAEGTRRPLAPLVLLWSFLQRSMVGYGYRPARALGWLVVSWVLGSVWFSVRPDLVVINSDDTLPWNPWLFTIDLLVPIVDFGNKNRWQTPGASQWVAVLMIVTGWTLATTVAAGLTRMLKRT